MLEKLKIAAIAAAVMMTPVSANALLVTHTFSGEVTFDIPGADSTLFEVGDAAEVVLQYDSAAPEVFPGGDITNYEIDNISIRFGDYVATTEAGLIRIGDNSNFGSGLADVIFIQTRNLDGPAIAGEFYSNFFFEFVYDVDTLSDETLPTFLPPVSSIFPSENSGLLFNGGPRPSDMRVDTITTVVGATVVPLPAALPLFLSAFVCLALVRVRRTHRG